MKHHVGLIIRDKDKVLFIQRSATKKTLPNAWAFVSGTMEEGESPERTAVREAKEELGVDAIAERVMAEMDIAEFGVRLHFVICSVMAGVPFIKAPDEIQTLRWMTFPEFFAAHPDEEIGHGLVWLRAHPEKWKKHFKA